MGLAEQDWPDTFFVERQLPDEDWRALILRLKMLRPDVHERFALLEMAGMDRAAHARAREARQSLESDASAQVAGVRAVIGPRGFNAQLFYYLSRWAKGPPTAGLRGAEWEERCRRALQATIDRYRRGEWE
ncbi:MAG TPA: hypothetical protein VFJ58_19955 [Armatimonadota bacterium]|nr:hypothetical protein [Armatimonadota bacterium]